MVYVILCLCVAAIYFIVYRFSKFFGMTNNTTILIDKTYESIRERRFKVPIWQLTISATRNVIYGAAIIFVVVGTVMIVTFVVTTLNK